MVKARGIKNGVLVEVECKKDGKYWDMLFNGKRNVEFESEILLAIGSRNWTVGGTFHPETEEQNIAAYLSYSYEFFDKSPEFVETDCLNLESEEGVIY